MDNRMLRFTLAKSHSTWFMTPGPTGKQQRFVEDGALVPAASVMKDTGEFSADGSEILLPNADYYINAGFAIVEVDSTDRSVDPPVAPAGG